MQFLKSFEGVRVLHQTIHGEYIRASAPVHIWEDIFETTFREYEIKTKAAMSPRTVIRSERYSLPIELHDHILTVFNTVQFAPDNLLTNIRLGSTQQNSATASQNGNDGIIAGSVTPALINRYYNVSNNNITSTATQAVFESLNSSYSPSDFRLFQKYFNLTVHPISQDIGGHACVQ